MLVNFMTLVVFYRNIEIICNERRYRDMNADIANKIKSAIDSTGLKLYRFRSMNNLNFDNDGETKFVDIDTGTEAIHNVQRNYGGAYKVLGDKEFLYRNAGYPEISEFEICGDYNEITAFLEAMGIELTDERVKILKNIDTMKRDIVPFTGDYTFKVLSQEEYDALTPEEKEKYDAEKKQYDLRKAGISGRASISIDM